MGPPRTSSRRTPPVALSSDEDGSSQPTPTSTPSLPRAAVPASFAATDPNRSKLPSPTSSAARHPSQNAVQRQQSESSSQRKTSNVKAKSKPKTIHSFFNAATQRQQDQARVSSSPEKKAAVLVEDEEDDLISDASFDEELGKLADEQDQSSLALPLRKRARNIFEQNTNHVNLPAGSQKFRKASDGSKAPSLSEVPSHASLLDDQRPWTEKYAPNNLEELAVHKKKVADVRLWLESVFAGRARQRLLVLKGVAGTGKTTTMQILAKELGFDINEWRNPVRTDSFNQDYVSVASQFEDFLGRSGKFQTLEFDIDKKNTQPGQHDLRRPKGNQLILMEEFPNTFTRSSIAVQRFRTIILQYLAANTSPSHTQFLTPSNVTNTVIPLVMVVSETSLSAESFADSFTVHRLLGPEIITHPASTVIEFNAVAPTFLTKALELIVLKESRKTGRRQTPGPQVISRLAEVGDIRSAVSTLEFLCLRGDDKENAWSGRVTFSKPKGSSKRSVPLSTMEAESLAIITQRESTLGIFHSVGKVVYNKREVAEEVPQPPEHLTYAARARAPDTDPNSLFDEMGTDSSTFIAALHENYILSCSASDSDTTQSAINGCIDALSISDLLSLDRLGPRFQGSGVHSFRQEEISFQVGVRGLFFSLPYPVKRLQLPGAGRTDAFKMMFPVSIKLWRQRSEIEDMLELLTSKVQKGSLMQATKVPRRGGVEAWSKAGKNADYPVSPSASQAGISQDDQAYPVLLAGGSSARNEMLFERLPYMALIQRSCDASANVLRETEKVTKFTGIGVQDNEIPDETDEGQNAVVGVRHPVFKKPEQKPSASSDNVVDAGVQGLVLSDDDIEDD